MDEQIQRISNNEFLDVSSVSDIVHYAGLLHRVMDLSSDIIEYNKVVKEYEKIVVQEERKRLETIITANKEMTELLSQLDRLEKELLADISRLKVFVEGTMDFVQQLIREGRYELADKFHERVANSLEGRASLVMNKFNQANSGGVVFTIDENE